MHDYISKELLAAEYKDKMLSGEKVATDRFGVDIVNTAFGKEIPNTGLLSDRDFAVINNLKSIHRGRNMTLSGKIQNGLEFSFKKRGSIADRIMRGTFASGNTMLEDWTDLWDAVRLDITMRKAANPTIRQYLYDEIFMPDATKDIRISELYPYGFIFEKNNGEGQSVKMGANLGGASETIPMYIYAAGFTWTLLASLFDRTYDISRMTEGVAIGEAAKKDDLAVSPILDQDYGTVDTEDSDGVIKWTGASDIGEYRQEKFVNTMMDGIDGFGEREDPVTHRKIVAENLVAFGTPKDMRHLAYVKNGLGKTTPENYDPLRQITQLVAYDGETIDMPNQTVTYTAPTDGYIYLIKKNRYMKIPQKRKLTVEVDPQPDVERLAMEKRAWYFVEALYSEGTNYYIQKVTLPTW